MKFHFNKINSFILILGIIFTIAGYVIMGTGDITISPIMLIVAYLILFPLAIILGINKKE